jgi:hypothetical protein
MSRSSLLSVGLLITGGAVLSETAALADGHKQPKAPQYESIRKSRQAIPWLPLTVGARERSLLIQYYLGMCMTDHPTVRAHANASRIWIEVLGEVVTGSGPNSACLPVARTGRAEVRLTSGIHGRRIEGPQRAFKSGRPHSAAYRTANDGDTRLWVVPRTIGLAGADARWVLRAQGFQPLIRGSGTRVVRQKPLPNHIAPDQHGTHHGVVTLTLGS